MIAVDAAGPLMVELGQAYDLDGCFRGAVVVRTPSSGPLVGRVFPGDLLVSVDGESMENRPLSEIVGALKKRGKKQAALAFWQCPQGNEALGTTHISILFLCISS